MRLGRACAMMLAFGMSVVPPFAGAMGQGVAGTSTFARAVDRWLDVFARRHPSIAAGNGIHTYDDRMEDFSATAMRREVGALRAERARIASFDAATLTADERVDQRILTGIIDGWLLDVSTVESWRKNPMVYGDALFSGVHNLMTMESAAPAARARTLIRKLRGVGPLLAAARSNLANPPRVYAQKGLSMFRGASATLGEDVAVAFATVPAPLRDSLRHATVAAKAKVDSFIAWYDRALLPRAKGSFAIGKASLEARYRAEELIDLPVERLLAIGQRELQVQQAAFVAAAQRIAPGRSAMEVWNEIATDHPAPGQLVGAAEEALARLTAFVTTKELAGVPPTERPIVSPAPPFDLGLASSHASPPLERRPVTSYYYITDARTDWPADRQEQWLRKFNRATLAIITAHEVMPGHWLHSTYMRRTPGKVRRIWIGLNPFPQPSSGQDGWAHYAEQLVVDEGFADGDPRFRMAQLSEALTRICRLIASARLHLGQWTVDEAAAFFEREAHLPTSVARLEAERGTYDPTNGGYFLGKLAALKLRRDVMAREGAAFSLRHFHERVMTNGIAPWWAHRQLMLPGDTSAVVD